MKESKDTRNDKYFIFLSYFAVVTLLLSLMGHLKKQGLSSNVQPILSGLIYWKYTQKIMEC